MNGKTFLRVNRKNEHRKRDQKMRAKKIQQDVEEEHRRAKQRSELMESEMRRGMKEAEEEMNDGFLKDFDQDFNFPLN